MESGIENDSSRNRDRFDAETMKTLCPCREHTFSKAIRKARRLRSRFRELEYESITFQIQNTEIETVENGCFPECNYV